MGVVKKVKCRSNRKKGENEKTLGPCVVVGGGVGGGGGGGGGVGWGGGGGGGENTAPKPRVGT